MITIDDYRRVAPPGAVDMLLRLAERVRGRRLLHVSGGRFGGGSAEILHTLVPMMADLGVDAGWEITGGDPGFYTTATALRATLDGAERVLTDEALDHYVEMNRINAKKLSLDADLVLVHDVAKPETRTLVDGRIRFFQHDVIGATRVRTIGGRLRLPERVTTVVERLVRHHLRPMHLASADSVTARARYRFFRDLGADTRDLLLLALVDAAAVRGDSPLAVWRHADLIRELLRGWEEQRLAAATPPLIRGEDVMQRFGLTPGPEVGRLLERAREAQALGLVGTREEALAYLDSPGDDS